jgi:hypothetical protein
LMEDFGGGACLNYILLFCFHIPDSHHPDIAPRTLDGCFRSSAVG